MAKLNVLTHLFNTGRVSRAALNRVDKESLRLYAEQQENLMPHSIGKAGMRPGLQKLGVIGRRARLIAFAKSPSATGLLELSEARLRVWVGDQLVTRPAVSATVLDPTFATGASWTMTTTGAATSSFGSNGLFMAASGRGGSISARQQVTTASPAVQHALRITVASGKLTFRCGSTANGDEYFADTTLEPGNHSLTFIPIGTSFHIRFLCEDQIGVRITFCQVEPAGPMDVPAPWSESSLRSIRHQQSLDVVFIAQLGVPPVKIERRGNQSWSVVSYLPEDGPFMLAPTSKAKLNPDTTSGFGTVTSSQAIFKQSHVGTLLKMTHQTTNQTTRLCGVDEVTPSIRVVGVNYQANGSGTNYSDRRFTITISGTWIGSLQLQRSFDGPEAGFQDMDTTAQFGANPNPRTTNGVITVNDIDNNLIVWYRIKMISYTSGNASVRFTYGQASGTGIMRITAVNSSTSASMQVLKEMVSEDQTDDWLLGAWSSEEGWPSAVALFDGRLFFAGDDRLWGSVSDDFYSFDIDIEGDSASIQRDIAAGDEFAQVNSLLSLQRLIACTSGAEISARTSSFDEPLTPTNITMKPASTFGASEASPVRNHSRGLFIDVSQTRVVELAYSLDAQDYVGSDMTRFNEDLYESDRVIGQDGFVELAVQRAPQPYIWALRADGVACFMLFNPAEEIRSWFTLSTGIDQGDALTSVAVVRGAVEDAVYFQAEREINGAIQITLERLSTLSSSLQKVMVNGQIRAKNGLKMLDSYITFTGNEIAGQVITGLDHLEGREVMIVGQVIGRDFGPLPETFIVSGGAISTGALALTGAACAGLGYPGLYHSAKLAYGAQKGTALTMKKRIDLIGLALLDTHPDALRVGPRFDLNDMDELPRVRADLTDVELGPDSDFDRALEEYLFPFPGEWDTDARACIYVRPGYSATLSGVIMGINPTE